MPTDFASTARSLVPQLDDAAIAALLAYRDRLATSAAEFNLTSVRDPVAIERRHLIESLAFGRLLAERDLLPPGARVLDLGSGAGLPGLPLKVAWPELRLTLLEATGKKCRFLESAVAKLSLEGVEVAEGRAEDVAHDPAHRGAYDLVVARAVARLPVLLEYGVPFLRLGGTLAGTKGSAARTELAASGAALQALGAEVLDTPALATPGLPAQTVILVAKRSETPERYPRRTGIPSKRPIA
jgi:16S rRNA (guanine527-N7)-methyltransferase